MKDKGRTRTRVANGGEGLLDSIEASHMKTMMKPHGAIQEGPRMVVTKGPILTWFCTKHSLLHLKCIGDCTHAAGSPTAHKNVRISRFQKGWHRPLEPLMAVASRDDCKCHSPVGM
eukprot:3719852-Amphidinium_carterae.1